MNLKKSNHLIVSLAAGGALLAALLLFIQISLPIARAAPAHLFVSPTGSGDACTQAAPCALQTALDGAAATDTIYSAEGIYTGSGGAVISLTKSITLYGGWDGTATTPVVRDPETYPTILHGEDVRRGVYISGSITPTLDGFIISGGAGANGGGVYVFNAAPLLQNNVITANRTITTDYDGGQGGGIFVGGNGRATIAQNDILSNTAGYGGGVYHNSGLTVTITANVINGNVAADRGGGVMIERSPDILEGNVISENTAVRDGGGVMLWNANPRLDANRLHNNSAGEGGGVTMGNNSRPTLFNNLLVDNSEDGLLIIGSSPEMVNNTIVGSGLPDSGDAVHLTSFGCSPPYCTTGRLINNIIVNYEVGVRGSGTITPFIDYNDVWSHTVANYDLPGSMVTGTHNISQDPLFANPAVSDYHLQADSPAVDAGDPAGAPPAPNHDIDGETRPIGARVDIGADEVPFRIFLPVIGKR